MRKIKKFRRILIETFAILLMQVLNKTQAGCTWGTSNCVVSCSSTYISHELGSETAVQVLAHLGQIWKERESCHSDGIILKMENVVYPNFNLAANWFTAQVKVKELEFRTSSIVTTIEANAFNATALRYVTKLTFPSMGLDIINTGIFNGLESLEELIFGSAKLGAISNGVLDPLSATLKHFSLSTSSKYWGELWINGLTGSGPLLALTTVKYDYNLKSTINRNSFAGLENVITLDLSGCQIETIGAGAFDPISNSVRELKLTSNEIKTLPDGIFHNILLVDMATIMLGGNKWQCDCDLMPFKLTLIENNNSNFDGPFTCNNQPLRGLDVITTNFCPEYVPPTTTSTTSTTTTTTTTTTTATTEENTSNIPTESSIPEELSQTCYEAANTAVSKSVSIKTPRSGLRINEDVHGDPMLEVEAEVENSVLIWFSQLDKETYHIAIDDITCVIGSGNAIPITDLKKDIAYTFCLMDSTEKTVSPLDCISYTNTKAVEQPWIYDDSRSLIISMAALACFISVLIGYAIGFLTLNRIIKNRSEKQKPNGMSCINDVLKEAFQSNSMMRQQHRPSVMTTSSGNTKRTTNFTVDYYLESAPPLPARPSSMHPFEEPIYAVVRDCGTVK